MTMTDITSVRADFPFLQQRVHGKPVTFLDTAASAQKPQAVIDTITQAYQVNYANIHRGVYTLSDQATGAYEAARTTVCNFINASDPDEIIFTKGATEAINLVAYSLGVDYFQPGDEIIITQMEHHANIVPWQLLAQQKGLHIRYIEITQAGELALQQLPDLINDRTKLISLTHCSNVLGTINDVASVTRLAKAYQIPVLVDAAQSVAHQPVDVMALDCDFLVFSSHKLYGPTGVGVLYVKSDWYSVMAPYQSGGDMIDRVSMTHSTFVAPPHQFEAGTPNIVGVQGLKTAIDYIQSIGFDAIAAHEKTLLAKAKMVLGHFDEVTILGNPTHQAAVVTFVMDGYHANDIGTLLDLSGICVRTGHHCVQPLLRYYGVETTIRVSMGIYNTTNELDRLSEGMTKAMRMLKGA